MHYRHSLFIICASLLFLACGTSSSAPGNDAGLDQSPSAQNADGFIPLAGFGQISGSCGMIDDEEWNSTSPFFFVNNIDFQSATFDPNSLSIGGKYLYDKGNLGGSSLNSEIIAYEILYRCELAKLLKAEAEIEYNDPQGKKTDILVELDNRRVGVSVVRAYRYPPTNPYTENEALTLLTKKLSELKLSQANAKEINNWNRSLLSVLAYDAQYAEVIQSVWNNKITTDAKGDTIVIMTQTMGNDDFIYQ